MLYSISSTKLSVVVSSMGACLTSLRRLSDQRELLWQGDETIWKGQAPVLFPFIGRLKNETYLANEIPYHMKIHGFASQSEFSALQEDDTAVVFTLTASEATQKVYPFRFSLSIRYEIKENLLVKTHSVSNLSGKPMYYEIGGHEGYNLALLPGERMSEYYVEFENAGQLYTYTSDKDVMINREKKILPLMNNRLYLDMEDFRNDAFIVDEIPGRLVTIGSENSSAILKVKFSDFPYLGIWTRYLAGKDTNYVCLEPWSSLPDCNYLDYKIENKEGIRHLAPYESESMSYSIHMI